VESVAPVSRTSAEDWMAQPWRSAILGAAAATVTTAKISAVRTMNR